jgi:hypothetical protein
MSLSLGRLSSFFGKPLSNTDKECVSPSPENSSNCVKLTRFPPALQSHAVRLQDEIPSLYKDGDAYLGEGQIQNGL